MRKPFLISSLIGIIVLAVGLLINFIGPAPARNLPGTFLTPVIAFEFATEDEHIKQIFGEEASPDRDTLLQKMTNSTRLDFLFLLFYGAFLFSFSVICSILSENRLFYLAALFAILAPLFDMMENLQMLSIMEQVSAGKTQFDLVWLHTYTWAKWGALAFAFLLLVPFLRFAGRFGRLLSFFAIVTFSLGILAFINPGLLNELFAVSTVLMFVLLIIFSFTYNTMNKKTAST